VRLLADIAVADALSIEIGADELTGIVDASRVRVVGVGVVDDSERAIEVVDVAVREGFTSAKFPTTTPAVLRLAAEEPEAPVLGGSMGVKVSSADRRNE
jgi:hypothetical protein